MADNVIINPGISGGPVVATDDIGGAQYQRFKLIHGKNGTNDGDVSTNNPFPVNIYASDSPVIDAFERLRVSNPKTIFDSKLVETSGSLFWDTSLTGSATATWVPAESTYRLLTTGATGDKVVRQTKQYFGYQPGKSHLIMISGIMGIMKESLRQRIGYFDDFEGIFFEQTGGGAGNFPEPPGLKIVIKSDTSGSVFPIPYPPPPENVYRIEQSSWNLDPMDGTGPSGITINMDRTQIFIFDLEWLGVGRVRAGFVIDGKIYYCHEFLHANSLFVRPYMARPNLPIRYELESRGVVAGGGYMKQICSTVISEGGHNFPGVIRSVDTGVTPKTITSTLKPLLSLRLKNTFFPGTSKLIHAMINLFKLHFAVTNNQPFQWKLLYNPALGGASWSDVSSESIAQYDTTATAVSGGEVLLSGYVSSKDSQDLSNYVSRLNLGTTIAGVSDVFTIAAIRIGNSDSNGTCSLMFEEQY